MRPITTAPTYTRAAEQAIRFAVWQLDTALKRADPNDIQTEQLERINFNLVNIQDELAELNGDNYK